MNFFELSGDFEHMDDYDIIKKCSLFSTLNDQQLIQLITNLQKITLKTDEILFEQGDMADTVYVVLKGELISYFVTKNNQVKIVGSIRPVETVGELAVLGGEPRSLSVKAAMATELLKCTDYFFKQFCNDHPSVLTEISKLVIERNFKTIHLVVQENNSRINFIFAMQDHHYNDKLIHDLRDQLQDKNLSFSVNPSTVEITYLIKEAEIKQKNIYIFLTSIDHTIIKLCLDKLYFCYLIYFSELRQIDYTRHNSLLNALIKAQNARLGLVLIHPENTLRPINTKYWIEKEKFTFHHHVKMNKASDFARFIRYLIGKANLLVLSGGGARGLAHVGVLQAFAGQGIPIDAIGGTSSGAAMGAAFIFADNLPTFLNYVHQIKKSAGNSVSLSNLTWPKISLYSGNPGTKTLMDIFQDVCIE